MGVTSVALILFANFTLDSSLAFITASFTLAGAGMGIFWPPNSSSIMGSVPPERRGIANGVRSTIVNSGNAISIPLAMTLMTAVLPYDKLASIVNASILANQEEVLALLPAMSYAFYVLAFINLLGAIASIFREPEQKLSS